MLSFRDGSGATHFVNSYNRDQLVNAIRATARPDRV
jgi:hypothetical protein